MTRSGFTNVLICDTRGDALAAYVTTRRPDLVCRVRTADAVTAADRVWADTLTGFGTQIELDTQSDSVRVCECVNSIWSDSMCV